MKFKIIIKDLDIPLKEGVFTNRGVILRERMESNADYFDTKEGEFYKEELKPISVSLQEFSEQSMWGKPNMDDFKSTPIYLKPIRCKAYLESSKEYENHIESLVKVECSQELQGILLDKFNQGIEVVDGSELELVNIVDEWKSNLSDEEWTNLLKKHGHFHHDIGINADEVIQMWKDESNRTNSNLAIAIPKTTNQSNEDIWHTAFANAPIGIRIESQAWLKENYIILKK